MSDLQGKTFVITGANTGIGKVTAATLAKRGAHVVVACRSKEKTEPVIAEIRAAAGHDRVEWLGLDLSDLAAVRKAADQLLQRNLPIHCLINNAGLAGKPGLTADGFEITFGTNHLGHYLWTRMLQPALVTTDAAAPARIVNVASKAHYNAKTIDWAAQRQRTKSRTGMTEYSVSKLCNVLFTKELAARAGDQALRTYALHPGVVATDVWRQVPSPLRWVIKKFMITPEQGAATSIKTATDPGLASQTGRYYDTDGSERRVSRLANDPALARELWNRSAEWVGLPG
jgi:NAD(P)-dependent dehydrogenase (short-subunit alcohol dehydrogenase family)